MQFQAYLPCQIRGFFLMPLKKATELHLIHGQSSICLVVVDLGEEGVAGGDGLEVPGVGIGLVVLGQAVRTPVPAAEDGIGSHTELMAELASPSERGEQVSFCHAGRKAFSATEAGRSFHILYIEFCGRLGLIVAVIQHDGFLRVVRGAAEVLVFPVRYGSPFFQ